MPLQQVIHRAIRTVGQPLGVYPLRNSIRGAMTKVFKTLNINCVVDVGGHYGEYGEMTREVGYHGEIVSFEPVAASLAKINQVVQGHQPWRVMPYALGSSDGEAVIQIYESSELNSLHTPSGTASRLDLGVGTAETIQIRRLENLAQSVWGNIPNPAVYLKIDTQGHDLEVLKGAGSALSQVVAIQSELASKRLYADSPTYLQSLSFIEDLGYSLSGMFPLTYESDGLTVIEWDSVFVRRDLLQ